MGLIVRDEDADGQRSEDVEDQAAGYSQSSAHNPEIRNADWGADEKRRREKDHLHPPEHPLNSFLDIPPGILDLTTRNSHNLHATKRKRRISQRGEETQEPSLRPIRNKSLHSTRIIPVAKPNPILGRPPAQINNKSKDKQADNRQDLDTREPELRLAIHRHIQHIQRNDHDQNDGDPKRDIDLPCALPILYDDRRSGEFCRDGHGVGEPSIPADGETEGAVDIASAELGDHTWDGQPGGHLAEGVDHSPDGEAGECVAEEEGEGAGGREGAADAEEEAGADGAADGDELDVSRLQPVYPQYSSAYIFSS